MLNIGDRVELTRRTTLHDQGDRANVTRKYVPSHCTGVWNVTVRFDGDDHETSFCYPDPIIRKVAI
jgi:hypothetical protein